MTLTVDQRWLLMHMGTWAIVWALASPDGVARLMQSCWGSTTGRAANMPGAPAWLRRCGFETQSGAVHARAAGVSVRIKAAEINRYAAQLPVDIKAELVACRKASSENARCRR